MLTTIITHTLAFIVGAAVYALVVRKNPQVQADVSKVASTAAADAAAASKKL